MRAVGFGGRSGSGKTHLIVRLIDHFAARGMRVATVKHTHHHNFELDQPGKDSWQHREAGAVETLLLSDERYAILGQQTEPWNLASIQRRMQTSDLLLIEGFSALAGVPRIEVFRSVLGSPPQAMAQEGFVALAMPHDDHCEPLPGLPVLDLDDTAAIADFVLALPPMSTQSDKRRRGPTTRLAHLHGR